VVDLGGQLRDRGPARQARKGHRGGITELATALQRRLIARSAHVRPAFLYDVEWPAFMAVVAMATIPILILYLFFQRYFVAGIAASGVKG
jgi:hypothetical protein